MRHEARQVLEVPPEPVHIAPGAVDGDRLLDADRGTFVLGDAFPATGSGAPRSTPQNRRDRINPRYAHRRCQRRSDSRSPRVSRAERGRKKGDVHGVTGDPRRPQRHGPRARHESRSCADLACPDEAHERPPLGLAGQSHGAGEAVGHRDLNCAEAQAEQRQGGRGRVVDPLRPWHVPLLQVGRPRRAGCPGVPQR